MYFGPRVECPRADMGNMDPGFVRHETLGGWAGVEGLTICRKYGFKGARVLYSSLLLSYMYSYTARPGRCATNTIIVQESYHDPKRTYSGPFTQRRRFPNNTCSQLPPYSPTSHPTTPRLFRAI